MRQERYPSAEELSKLKNMQLGRKESRLLLTLVTHPQITMYRAVKLLAEEGVTIAPKNARKAARNLAARHLLLVHNGPNRNEKLYKLSPLGVLLIIRNEVSSLKYSLRDLVSNYGHLPYLEDLLYHYIGRDTVLKLEDSSLVARITSFLNEHYLAVEKALLKSDLELVGEEAFIWNLVPGVHDKRLIEFLKRTQIAGAETPSFRKRPIYKWELKRAGYKRFHKEVIDIRFREKEKNVCIYLDLNKSRAMIVRNRQTLLELIARQISNIIAIEVPVISAYSSERANANTQAARLHENLTFSLVMNCHSESDRQLLAQDKGLMQIVEALKTSYSKRADELMKIRESMPN